VAPNAKGVVFTSIVQMILIVTRLGMGHVIPRHFRVAVVAFGKQKYYIF